jgi:hypothetical protein
MLNQETQNNLSKEHLYLHYEDLHTKCREAVNSNNQLDENWISLFENGDPFDNCKIEDEIFLTLIMELFRDITEYFIRIVFVDALRQFNRTVPRKKKQALRFKVQALGDRDSSNSKAKKTKLDENIEDVYLCHACKAACEWDPAETENESIACDKCNCWFHYKCAKLKGT